MAEWVHLAEPHLGGRYKSGHSVGHLVRTTTSPRHRAIVLHNSHRDILLCVTRPSMDGTFRFCRGSSFSDRLACICRAWILPTHGATGPALVLHPPTMVAGLAEQVRRTSPPFADSVAHSIRVAPESFSASSDKRIEMQLLVADLETSPTTSSASRALSPGYWSGSAPQYR